MTDKLLNKVLSIIVCGFYFIFLASPAMAQDKLIIKVGYIPIGDCLQLYVAEDQGYFSAEGLSIEKTAMKGGAVIAPAVESGDIDIGWSNTISIIIAHAKGFDFKYLASGANEVEGVSRVNSLLVGKDSPIKEFKDLVGKTVAINTFGNINDLSIFALADANKVDIKKIKIVEVPFPEMETALKKGAVDAILTVEPFRSLSISHGSADYLIKSVHKSYGDKIMLGGWFARAAWAAKHPREIAAFTRAVNKASEFIKENPDKIPGILVKNTKLSEELAKQIELPTFDPKFDAADLQAMIDFSAKYNFIDKAFPAKDIMVGAGK
jgi:NitT/TauT family transport system substrate-binding protein